MAETIYEAKWEELLPEILKSDKKTMALVKTMAECRRKAAAELVTAGFWNNIDLLPVEMLDVLAYDLKVDWWDESYSESEKRKLLKDCIKIHKHKGTKYAVETAISAIYEGTKVEEWWEYGGDPYCFRLLIDATYEDVDPERHAEVLKRVNLYKNLRSHLDGVEYTAQAEGVAVVFAAVKAAGIETTITTEVKVYGLG